MKSKVFESIHSFFSVSPRYRFIVAVIIGLLLGLVQMKILYLIPIVILLILLLRLSKSALLLGLIVTYKFTFAQPIPFFVEQSYFYKSILVSLIISIICVLSFIKITAKKEKKETKKIDSSFLNLFRMVCKRKNAETKQKFIFYDSTSYRWVLFKVFVLAFLSVFAILIAWLIFNLNINPLNNIKDNYRINNEKRKVFGFYLGNDKNSKNSLIEYGGYLNVLIPDWYSYDEKLNLKSSIKNDVDGLAADYKIKEMPLVTGLLDEKSIDKISTKKRDVVIDQLYYEVREKNYRGITIDFKIDKVENEKTLQEFMANLYEKFNDSNIKVAYVVSSENNLFNSTKFSNLADYIIVKLYNESIISEPIAPQKWFKEGLNAKNIPHEKLVISVGCFGRESVQNSNTHSNATFNQIMKLCGSENLSINWDRSYNNPYLKFNRGQEVHTIWFLDGAAFYNQLNILSENKIKKVAIWPLGYEDSTIWNVLKKDNSVDNLQAIRTSKDASYEGEGELLKITSEAKDGLRSFEFDDNGFITNETYNRFPSDMKVKRYGSSSKKVVVLTFDDGPDPKYTNDILKILDKYKIKATFFVVGKNAERNPEIVKKIFDSGHEIGNHTYSHPNLDDAPTNEIEVELNATQRILQGITGHSTVLFRTPYGTGVDYLTNRHLQSILSAQKMGYTTVVGAVIDPYDWKNSNPDQIVKNISDQLYLGNIILLHDSGGDRSNTVIALPKIIETLKSKGYSFVSVGELLGKERQEIMVKVNENKTAQYDLFLSQLVGYLSRATVTMLTLGTILVVLRLLIILRFSLKNKLKKRKKVENDYEPFISVIVPAYNEHNVICKTINSILQSNYENYEIIVVNDGSTDLTKSVLNEKFKDINKVKSITKPNGGKSSAINVGIQNARGEIIITVDADTVLDKNAIGLMVKHFFEPNVAAVGGNIVVGNVNNALTIWQYIEYIIGFNLDKRAYDELNCITVVPGALGAWRKSVIVDAGYFDNDTLAEDTEMTIRILKKGYKITIEENAYCYTEAPQDVKSLLKQRHRWTYGTLQCLWKHKDALFNKKYKALGFFALPNMVIFQYIFYPIAVITELTFYISLLNGWVFEGVMKIYISLIVISFINAIYSFVLEKVKFKYLLWVIPMYIIYRMLIATVVIKSIILAIKGEIIGWNKLKREGNVMEGNFP